MIPLVVASEGGIAQTRIVLRLFGGCRAAMICVLTGEEGSGKFRRSG